jgi:putative Mg2+ transporter-C (MgtC) family protein
MDAVALPVTYVELAGRMMLATVFGALVGLNRERQGKPAGLRTHALVSLGSALLALVALFFGQGDTSAPGRVLQGVLAGVGFIGAGVILHRGDPQGGVQGLTTAAAIWVVAAIGVATGAGLWRTAATALGLTLLILIAGDATDRWIHRDKPSDLIEKPPG